MQVFAEEMIEVFVKFQEFDLCRYYMKRLLSV